MTHAAQYITTHGALLLFTWILVQQAGLPVPGASLLFLIGSLASSGRIDLASSLGAAIGGCLVADGFWYRVGRLGTSKYHHVLAVTGNWKGRVLAFITRHAAGALVPAKFISVSNVACLLAGRASVPAIQFLVFDSIASLAWAGGYVTIGYLLRSQVHWAVAHALRPILVVLGATAVWPLAVLLSHKSKRSLRAAALMAATILCCALPAASQYGTGMGGASGYAASQSSVAVQAGGLTGSVPSGPASNEILRLTLRDAITRGLRYNLAPIESGENARIARGQRLLALSKLLPQVSVGASENVEQINLATFGLQNIPGIPTIIGPLSYSSVGANLSQTLFSYESIQRFRAARTAEQAAQLSYNDVLDIVTFAIGNAYLQVIEANSRIEAQEAQVRNARALYDQALDEVQAGTAPRIEATRTEVQLHSEEYNLSVSRNSFDVAKLNLSRAIGLPLGQQFELADQIPYSDIDPPTVGAALTIAYTSRSDLRAAFDSAKAAAHTFSAAKAERFPVAAVNGDYGDVGPTFGHSHGDFAFQVGVNVPIFTGGRIKGDITQAQAELRQRKAEAENLRGQIDYDVRTAFLNLNAAKEQVEVAKQNVALANESLARSKDRFTSGVTDSVEVVQAEQALANANDQYVTGLYNHNFAKLSLARALGVARTSYQQYLGGT
jgi:outer membrane protein TolC/membrane protein DedA with SNARE-associated domain